MILLLAFRKFVTKVNTSVEESIRVFNGDTLQYQIAFLTQENSHCLCPLCCPLTISIVVNDQWISVPVTLHALSNKLCPCPWKFDIIISANAPGVCQTRHKFTLPILLFA